MAKKKPAPPPVGPKPPKMTPKEMERIMKGKPKC